MARYSHKGHDMIRYDIRQNIAIRYDTIWNQSASPYVRTASKQATAHNTGAPSFCLSTLSPLQVPRYWAAGVPWSPGLFSRATVSTGRQTIAAVFQARLKYLVIAQSLNIWAARPPSQSTHRPTREAGQLLRCKRHPLSMSPMAFTETESCAEYRLRWRGNYRDKDMPQYDLNIAIFDTIRYIVPSLVEFDIW